MIAPHIIPRRYEEWNCKRRAPCGRLLVNRFKKYLPSSLYYRMNGPFSWQANNLTRRFEYPWAFYAAPLTPGMRVLEIGGGLSGFQFVLDQAGCSVVNVDPGMDAEGGGWPCDQESISKINGLFGTSVQLMNTTIDRARLEPESFDRIYSISVIEHMTREESLALMRALRYLLKPGGYFIFTVDLFINLYPFTSRKTNEFGINANLKLLNEAAALTLVAGNPAELYGYPEFDKDKIQSRLETFLMGYYPAVVQCVVLQK